MSFSPEDRRDVEALPSTLRNLLEAELAAGNEVVEVGHSHPAPPAGAYFMLARPVSTRARTSGEGIVFYERHSSHYSGEFTDAARFYFVLEPPRPPPAEPDMDAIRADLETRQQAADVALRAKAARAMAAGRRRASRTPGGEGAAGRSHSPSESELVARFRSSMQIDYERWKEGVGYDLGLIHRATPAERAALEEILLIRGVHDWRDVEALAALDTPRARAELRDTLTRGKRALAIAVLRHAPHLASDTERTNTIVAALAETTFFDGLTQTLDQVEKSHPPAVIDALLHGVLHREGGEAVHFAAMLMLLHGKARTRFDWELRPYFLRFNTNGRDEREVVFRDLCQRIDVDPTPFLPQR